ncbi:MAG: 2-amino-4-hydroxy-6-hydroxymethyldihydropteridine diphosphokinase [bacterium]|nr:2-amino-4-hydroxy-6-hydroxymethyldihydropteridine diphosphokinase [bacterium]
MLNKVYLGIGSNLGDRLANIKTAISELTSFIEIEKSSSIYDTSPWGYKKQPDFLNCVVYGKTPLTPLELLEKLQSIEKLLKKDQKKEKFGPRTIDMDILFYNDESLIFPNLVIPHPLLHLRKFVLVPMNELNPGFIHPVLKKTISALLRDLKSDETCIKKTNEQNS